MLGYFKQQDQIDNTEILHFRISTTVKNEFNLLCIEHNTTMSAVLRNFVKSQVNQKEKTK